jgi:hypothetical protein
MRSATVFVMATLLLVGCYNPPRSGVSPAPPGPLDLVNILVRQDYDRLCPEHYDYCQAGKRSICCPNGGCCEDTYGPYCCDSGSYDRGGYSYEDRQRDDDRGDDRGPCGPRSTTCARGGRTICCAEHEGCCADRRGLYCCAASDRDYDRDRY